MNIYLQKKREQYDALKSSIEGLQTRAAEANRGMTEDELRSVQQQGEEAKRLAAEIESLTEIETRNAKVAALASQLQTTTASGQEDSAAQGESTGEQTRSTKLGGATTRDRDPGFYTRSSEYSFFGDMFRQRRGEEAAAKRLALHNRALDTAGEGIGLVAPKWIVSEFETLARQGRALANAVRNIPLGDDPRPITLPKQTAGTDAEVTEQANENDPIEDDDAFDTDVDTVIPKPTAGSQIVSRQMLDMASPAIDLVIYGDLISAYNLKVEKKVGNAVNAVGTALAATSSNFYDVAQDAALAVWTARKLPANLYAMTVPRWGEFTKLKDSTGRPLVVANENNPMNAIGTGSVVAAGRIHGISAVATEGMPSDATFAALRAEDVLLFESNILRFRYEEKYGPQSVELGIWGYTAVIVRQGTNSVKRVTVA